MLTSAGRAGDGHGCLPRCSGRAPAPVDAPPRLRQRPSGTQIAATVGALRTRPGANEELRRAPLEELPLPGGSSTLPFVGVASDLMGLITEKHVFLSNQVKRHGSVSRASLLGKDAIIVAGCEHLSQVFLKRQDLLTQGYFGPLSDLIGQNSILGLDGEEHMILRRLMAPAFSGKDVYSYVPTITRLAEEHCSDWARRGSVVFVREIRHYAFSVTAEAALGMDFPVGSWTKGGVLDVFRTWVAGILSFGIDLPFTKFGRAMEARRQLIEMAGEMIEGLKEGSHGGGALRALAFARDEDGNGLGRDQLQDTILSLLFAGYDTVAAAASNCMLELARHPKAWNKLRQEQDAIVARHGPDFTEASLEAMTYTEAVVREALRVLPPVDGTFKTAARTFELGGRRIPQGSTVFAATGCTAKHFDGRWPLDTEFRPERHLPCPGMHPGDELVFSMGAHACPGRILFIVESKILLATLARGYDFAVANTEPGIASVPFPQPADGLPMAVRRREGPSGR